MHNYPEEVKSLGVVIWNMQLGGVQRQLADILKYMSVHHQQLRVTLWIQRRGVGLFPELLDVPRLTIKYMDRMVGNNRRIVRWWRFYQQVLATQPDIILTFHDLLSMRLFFMRLFVPKKYRLIVYEPNLTSVYMRHFRRSFIGEWFMHWFYRYIDLLLVTTQAAKGDLHDHFNVPLRSIRVVPTWSVWSTPTRNSFNQRHIDCLFVGRLEPQKQPMDLLKMMKALKKTEKQKVNMVVIGDGSLKPKMELQTKHDRLAIRFEGVVKPSKVIIWMKQAKCLLLPSLYEGMPLVVLEANSCGTVPIMNNFPGAREVVIDQQTGIITHSVSEMIEAVQRVCRNQAVWDELSDKGYTWARRHGGINRLKDFVRALLQ